MKRNAVKIVFCLLLLALAAPLGACVSRARSARTPDGRTLFRLGLPGMPDSLNPYAAGNGEAAAALSLLYDTLFCVDIDSGEYVGSLCQEWTVTDGAAQGGRLWRVTLRPDVKWHDGEPLTASDVEFSLQSVKDFSARFSYPDSEYIDATGIAVEDDTHLSFIVWGAESAVIECLSHIPILPRHVWNRIPGMEYNSSGVPRDYALARATLYDAPADETTMIGSGLYTWGGYENGICTLLRNDGYWNGAARAEVVELRYGCADPAGLLRAGELDACWNMPGASYEALGREGGYALTAGTEGELYLIGFNLYGSSGRGALLRSADVRRAMDYCLSRAEILNGAFGGGIPAKGLLSPCSPWYYEDALAYPRDFSPASAAWLLENTGYPDADGDGVRSSQRGEKLSFDLLCSDAVPAWTRAAYAIKDSFAQAGIELTVTALPPEELLAAVGERDFDLLLTGVQCYNDPFYTLGAFYWNNGENAFSTVGLHGDRFYPGWNFSGYQNGDYDALYERMLYETGEVRQEQVLRLGEMLYNDAVVLPIGFAADYQACSGAWRELRAFRGTGLYFTPEILRQQLQGMTAAGRK